MEHWGSFLYLYLVGGGLFFLALFLAIKKKALRLHRKADRWIFRALIGAYVFYFSIQGIWNILAIRSAP